MMDIKAVFLDIDNTMTSEKDGQLMESCRTACQQLSQKSIAVVIATGRQGLCVPCIQDGLVFPDYIMGGNGATLYDGNGRVIYNEHLDRQLYEEVNEFCLTHGIDVFWKFADNMYAYPGESQLAKECVETLRHFVIGLHPDPEELPGAGGLVNVPPEVLMEFRRQFAGRISCVDGGYYIHDLNSLHTDKGTGLMKMAQLLGISPEQCAAFGDSENDIPMLRAAGVGVAMGNAMEGARQAADYVTARASEDGVLKALEKFGIL
ncbi:MAG: HAD family hydrolase [Erysipelotrichaceae bacterium]|nr:HAD family hydrolase [Erysipelotrichaceae bacterium]